MQLAAKLRYDHLRPREIPVAGAAPRAEDASLGSIRLRQRDFSAREVFGHEGQFFEGKTQFIGRKPYRTVVRRPPMHPVADQSMGEAATGSIPTGGLTVDRGTPYKEHGSRVRKGDIFRRLDRRWRVIQIQEIYPNEKAGVLSHALRYICEEAT